MEGLDSIVYNRCHSIAWMITVGNVTTQEVFYAQVLSWTYLVNARCLQIALYLIVTPHV